MRRRRFLKTAPILGLSGLAGCQETEVDSDTTNGSSSVTRTDVSTTRKTPASIQDLDFPWSQLPGPPGGPVTDIAPSPADPNYLYTTTWTAGLYASSDGGHSWIQGPPGAHHKDGIEASPHDPAVARSHALRTVDGGQNWYYEANEPDRLYIPGLEITAFLEFDPFDDQILYAGTVEGLYRTFDKGRSWEHVDIGVQAVSDSECRVEAASAQEGVVFAAFNQDATLVRSDDRGDSWEVVIGPEDIPITRGSIVAERSGEAGYITAGGHGIYRFGDGSPGRVTDPFRFYNQIALSADDERLYFLGRPAADSGDSLWENMGFYRYDAGVAETRQLDMPEKPSCVAAHPTDPSTVYFGGWSWVWESQDGGQTWTALENGFIDQYLAAVGTNPSHPGTVIPGSVCSTGVNVSHDHGETYEWKRSGLRPYHEGQFGEHYVMQVRAGGDRVYVTTGAGLLISTDNGVTWHLLENEFSGHGEIPGGGDHGGHDHGTTHLHGLDIDPFDSQVVYVGAGHGGGIGGEDDYWSGSSFLWKSEDGGETWREITEGYPTDIDTSIQDILVSSHDPEVVYAGTNAEVNVEPHEAEPGIGVFRSIDAGEHWGQLETPFPNTFYLGEDAEDPEMIYVSTREALFKSEDGGENWRNVLPYHTRGLVTHPTAADIVFVGARLYEGYWDLLVSEDGGETWAEGNLTIKMGRGAGERDYDGINRAGQWGEKGDIMDLAIDGANSHLIAATRGAGLWRGDFSRLID